MPLTTRKKHRAARLPSMIASALLALALLFTASPAFASESARTMSATVVKSPSRPLTTYDRLPGNGRSWYYSAGNGNGSFVPAARVRQQGGQKSWGIRWRKGVDTTVRVAISDLVVDGKRPIVVVSYDYGDGGTFAKTELTTNGREPTYSAPASVTIPWIKGVTDWRRQSVLVTVCNGRDDSGSPDECGTPHGPFHAY